MDNELHYKVYRAIDNNIDNGYCLYASFRDEMAAHNYVISQLETNHTYTEDSFLVQYE